jgi:hypothetical protein
MMKELVGVLAVAVTLSAGAPALARETSTRPASHVAIEQGVAAPVWTAASVTVYAPHNFEDTAPHPFAEGTR